MIEIDGSYGEGGGAILRQALGLAAYSGQAIRVKKIRAGRKRAGLAPQHLKAVEAVGALCAGQVRGARLGSQEITFEPGAVRGGSFTFDIGTAGSTTLLLQSLLLPCFGHAGEYEFRLTGGTDVPFSPPADYLSRVTLDALRRVGAAEFDVRRRGYYPQGGGRLFARLLGGPGTDAPIEWIEPGEVRAIRGVSHASSLLKGRRVAERQADAADHLLKRLGATEIAVEYSNSAGPGSGITLWTESEDGPRLGGSALGVQGKPADEVGREAARALMSAMDAGAAVDLHLADQLVPFLAVWGGAVRAAKITPHVQSSIYVAERMLGAKFVVEGKLVRVDK
jgi:RNA 3'-terminal phosphate cyclase (GTP)